MEIILPSYPYAVMFFLLTIGALMIIVAWQGK